jgi:hypothetical protein
MYILYTVGLGLVSELWVCSSGAGDMVVDCEEEYLLLGPLGASLLDGNKE